MSNVLEQIERDVYLRATSPNQEGIEAFNRLQKSIAQAEDEGFSRDTVQEAMQRGIDAAK